MIGFNAFGFGRTKRSVESDVDRASQANINEMEDRKNFPVPDQATEIPERDTEDDEDLRRIHEKEMKFKKGEAYIPEEEIVDPDSEDVEDHIAEMIDKNEPEEEELFDSIVSESRNFLPQDVWEIKKKWSLSSAEWSALSSAQRKERLDAMQREIEQYYAHTPAKVMRPKQLREEGRTAA